MFLKMKLFFIILLSLVIIISCSGSRETTSDRVQSSAKKDQLQADLLSMDVSGLINNLNFKIEPSSSLDSIKILTDTTLFSKILKSGESNPDKKETVQGWRVQIIASENVARANEVYNQAIFKFSEKVYIEFEAPYNRVRVGNCRTRTEAVQLLEVVQQNGFQDAWIIRTRIEIESEDEEKENR